MNVKKIRIKAHGFRTFCLLPVSHLPPRCEILIRRFCSLFYRFKFLIKSCFNSEIGGCTETNSWIECLNREKAVMSLRHSQFIEWRRLYWRRCNGECDPSLLSRFFNISSLFSNKTLLSLSLSPPEPRILFTTSNTVPNYFYNPPSQ